MIDTIKIMIITKEMGFIKEFIHTNTRTNEKSVIPNTTFLNGSIRNIRIKVKQIGDTNEITLMGSLQVYYQGNNIHEFNHNDVKAALDDLSNTLGLDIKNGIIKRIDVGANICVKYKPSLYHVLLSSAKRYKKDSINNYDTVQFRKGHISLIFYDKVKQSLRLTKETELRSHLNSNNIIRYEIKLNKKLAYTLNSKEKVIVDKLYSMKFYKKLVRLWYREYISIYKISPHFSLQVTDSFKDYLQLEGIQSIGGYDSTIVMLNEWCRINDYSRQKKSRIKKQLMELQPMRIRENRLMKELSRKIKRRKTLFLSSI